jgi:hypothetical protein
VGSKSSLFPLSEFPGVQKLLVSLLLLVLNEREDGTQVFIGNDLSLVDVWIFVDGGVGKRAAIRAP